MVIDTGKILKYRAQERYNEELEQAENTLCKNCTYCTYETIPAPEFMGRDVTVGYCDLWKCMLNWEELNMTAGELDCVE